MFDSYNGGQIFYLDLFVKIFKIELQNRSYYHLSHVLVGIPIVNNISLLAVHCNRTLINEFEKALLNQEPNNRNGTK